jgi:hypothetical protein
LTKIHIFSPVEIGRPKRSTLLVDKVLPHQPIRQWVFSVPFPLWFLFASQPKIMDKALGIVYRSIATHLTHKAGYKNSTAHAGAVTLTQRFGSAPSFEEGSGVLGVKKELTCVPILLRLMQKGLFCDTLFSRDLAVGFEDRG